MSIGRGGAKEAKCLAIAHAELVAALPLLAFFHETPALDSNELLWSDDAKPSEKGSCVQSGKVDAADKAVLLGSTRVVIDRR